MSDQPGRIPTSEEAERMLRPSWSVALAAWRALVAADYEQVTRIRETPEGVDTYHDTAGDFRPNGELPAPELALLEPHLRPGETWIDIGAGGGRFALPIARRVGKVVALEPSSAMRHVLESVIAETGQANIEVVDLRWPPLGEALPQADVTFAANVLYDQREVDVFLDAMERHARRLCVAVLGDRGRGAGWDPIWEAIHGERPALLPSLREFVALLGARDRRFEVQTIALPWGGPVLMDRAVSFARRLLWLEAGSEKDRLLPDLLRQHFGTEDGRVALPSRRRFNGVVTWEPFPLDA